MFVKARIVVVLLGLLAVPFTTAQTDTRPIKIAEPMVGTFYFYWYRHPSEHFQNSDGSDALFQHFEDPKKVDYQSSDWHRGEMEAMMEAGIDVVLPVYWGIPDRPKDAIKSVAFADLGLAALVKAWDEIQLSGGRPPKIAMFYDTSTLLLSTRGEDGGGALDLRTERGFRIFCDTIIRFYEQIPERMRFDFDRHLVIVLYSSFGAAHDIDFLDRVEVELRTKLKKRVYLIAEESWKVRADARYRWGAALSGPTGDSVVRVVGPGYNDTAVPGRSTPIRSREDGRFYLWSWNQVLMDQPTLVFIETWNEFHEGTGIAPSKEFGTKYLDITRRSILRLKNRMMPDSTNPVRLTHPDPTPRPDEGWWKPEEPGQTTVGFSAANADGDRGKGLRLGRTEDGEFKFEYLADRSVVTTAGKGRSTAYLYFGIADEFARSSSKSFEIEIEFIDGGQGSIALQYDSWDARAVLKGAYKSTPSFERRGLPRTGQLVFTLPDARFANRQNGGCDFRLVASGDELSIGRVTVRELPEKVSGEPRVERK